MKKEERKERSWIQGREILRDEVSVQKVSAERREKGGGDEKKRWPEEQSGTGLTGRQQAKSDQAPMLRRWPHCDAISMVLLLTLGSIVGLTVHDLESHNGQLRWRE